jgi:DNA-binding NarL/FixJ family response regulator
MAEANAAISILLVDDNKVFRDLAARFLGTLAGVKVAGTADGVEQGVVQALALHPDLILVDLHMRDGHGLEAIPRLRELMPDVGIIALSLLEPRGFQYVSIEAGADEFVDKMTMVNDLLPAIQKVSQQKPWWVSTHTSQHNL